MLPEATLTDGNTLPEGLSLQKINGKWIVSGSTVQVGLHQFSLNITDEAGNTTVLSHAINVTDQNSPVFGNIADPLTVDTINADTPENGHETEIPVTDDVGVTGITFSTNPFENTEGNLAQIVDGKLRIKANKPGSYTGEILAVDAAGNEARKTINLVLNDATAPTFTLTNINENANTTDVHTFDVESADNSGVEPTLTLEGAHDNGISLTGKTVSVDIDMPGVYQFTIKAVDANNNTSRINGTVTVTDNTVPVISVNPTSYETKTSQPNINIVPTVSDNSGQQPVLSIEMLNGTALPDSISFDNTTGTLTGQPTSPAVFQYRIKAVDSSNNIGYSDEISVQVTDDTAPTITNLPTDTVSANTSGVAVDIQPAITDNDKENPITIELLDGNTGQVIQDPTTALPDGVTFDPNDGSLTGAPESHVSPGSYTFKIKATDHAGNSTTSNKFTFKVVDSTLPSVTIEPSFTFATGEKFEFEPTVSDNSGWSYSEITHNLPDDVNTPELTGANAGKVKGESRTPGVYNITFVVQDDAGNRVTKSTQLTLQDRTAPLLGADPLDGGTVENDVVSFTTGTKDNLQYDLKIVDPEKSKITYTLEGAPAGVTINENGVLNFDTTVQPGSYDFKVKAVDHYGNVLYVRIKAELTDNTFPELTVPAQTTLDNSDNPVTITAAGTDNDESFAPTYAISGDIPHGLILDTATGVLSGTTKDAKPGNYRVVWTVTDNNGNSVSKTTVMTVTDTLAPVANYPVTYRSREHGGVVDILPDLSDNRFTGKGRPSNQGKVSALNLTVPDKLAVIPVTRNGRTEFIHDNCDCVVHAKNRLSGISVDPKSGHITGNVNALPSGDNVLTLVITDHDGNKTEKNVTITVPARVTYTPPPPLVTKPPKNGGGSPVVIIGGKPYDASGAIAGGSNGSGSNGSGSSGSNGSGGSNGRGGTGSNGSGSSNSGSGSYGSGGYGGSSGSSNGSGGSGSNGSGGTNAGDTGGIKTNPDGSIIVKPGTGIPIVIISNGPGAANGSGSGSGSGSSGNGGSGSNGTGSSGSASGSYGKGNGNVNGSGGAGSNGSGANGSGGAGSGGNSGYYGSGSNGNGTSNGGNGNAGGNGGSGGSNSNGSGANGGSGSNGSGAGGSGVNGGTNGNGTGNGTSNGGNGSNGSTYGNGNGSGGANGRGGTGSNGSGSSSGTGADGSNVSISPKDKAKGFTVVVKDDGIPYIVPSKNTPIGKHTVDVTVTTPGGDKVTIPIVVDVEPLPPLQIGRLDGPTRVETAVKVSQELFDDNSATTVLLARSDIFADAVAGTPYAKQNGAAVLLTPPTELHPATRKEILRVLQKGGNVHIMGGSAAISPEIEKEISSLGYNTKRVGGVNRFETAQQLYNELGSPSEVAIVEGADQALAVVAGTAMSKISGAVVFSSGTTVPDFTKEVLNEVNRVYAYTDYDRNVHNGRDVEISQGQTNVSSTTPGNVVVEYIEGNEPYLRSINTADRFFATTRSAVVSHIDRPIDAVVGGAYAAHMGSPLMLADRNVENIFDWLSMNEKDNVVIIGGDKAIPEDALKDYR